MNDKIQISTFYKFFQNDDREGIKRNLYDLLKSNNIYGTILIAPDGINGTIAGSKNSILKVKDFFKNKNELRNIEYKDSYHDSIPFYRMKVKLKKSIITMAENKKIVPQQITGKKIGWQNWNDVIDDPDTVLVDTRNDYEYKLGTFKNAINPDIKKFSQFTKFIQTNIKKDQKIAMFCTGGIRCERVSSHLIENGYKNISQLDGGILKYIENIDKKKSLWNGECFVFDNRVSLNHDLKAGSYFMCYACKNPIAEDDKKSQHFREGISCPNCYDQTSAERKKQFAQRQMQIKIAKSKGESHLKTNAVKLHNA